MAKYKEGDNVQIIDNSFRKYGIGEGDIGQIVIESYQDKIPLIRFSNGDTFWIPERFFNLVFWDFKDLEKEVISGRISKKELSQILKRNPELVKEFI